jgi:hypothetical protein
MGKAKTVKIIKTSPKARRMCIKNNFLIIAMFGLKKVPIYRKLNNNLSKVDIQCRKLRELGFDETNLGCFSLSYKVTNYTDKTAKRKRRKPLLTRGK